MNIFLSWSGDHSGYVASVLRDYIGKVIQEAECFFSKGDIQAGAPWVREIVDKLGSHSLGIVCVTKENQERPWINYEAGALGAQLNDARVVPLLIGMTQADLKGPLALLHAKLCNEAGLLDVFRMINAQAAKPLADSALKESFEMWWPRIERALNYSAPAGVSPQPPRDEREILEELLIGMRQLLRDREQSAGAVARLISSLPPSAMEEFWGNLMAEVHSKRPHIFQILDRAVLLIPI